MRFCGFAGFRWGKKQPGAAGGGRGSGNRPGISRLQNFLDENDQDCVFCEDLALPGLFVCLPCAFWGVPPCCVSYDHPAGGAREWVAIPKRELQFAPREWHAIPQRHSHAAAAGLRGAQFTLVSVTIFACGSSRVLGNDGPSFRFMSPALFCFALHL